MYTQYVILFFYSINIFHNSLSLCLCHHHHSSTNGPTNQYTGPPTTAACCSSAETVTCKLLENTQNFYVTFGYSQYILIFSSRHRYCLLSIYSFSNLLIVRSSLFLFCWSEEKTPNLSPRWLVAD